MSSYVIKLENVINIKIFQFLPLTILAGKTSRTIQYNKNIYK